MSLQSTASQTVGPFFWICFSTATCEDLAPEGVAGKRIVIRGRVLDGNRKIVPDAVIEIWQANAEGKYAHPDDKQDKPTDPRFKGYGRSLTDDAGNFCFKTIRPGRVPGLNGTLQAPHIAITVFARGLLKQLVTRMYFPNEPSNAADTILNLVPEQRRSTLIARRVPDAENIFEWNIVLQGEGETVFFDF